ncbi:hypothetical protein JCM31739_00530 [Faecalimonas canis]
MESPVSSNIHFVWAIEQKPPKETRLIMHVKVRGKDKPDVRSIGIPFVTSKDGNINVVHNGER